MTSYRMGAVFVLLLIFALSFAALVRYTDSARSSVFDARCRVSSDGDCFGPYR